MPAPQRSRRSNGFLFGCLASGFVVVALVVGAIIYAGWFMSAGYKNDPDLKNALAMVRASPVAQSVLGVPIAVEGMESETFSTATGDGKTVSYTVKLKGARAEGQVHVMLHSDGGEMKVVSIVLTGPGNERYTLSSQQTAPASSI